MNKATRDKLFAAIRRGMGLEVPSVALTQEDSASLLKIAKRQSIFPIVYQGLSNLGVSEEYLKEYDTYRMKSISRVVQHDDALKRVSNALDSANIPYIFLKGATLRHLYPQTDMRTSCDIDILVKEELLDSAIKIIEQSTDFKTENVNYHDVSMVSSKVHLELHFNIKENMENLDRELINAWEYVRPAGAGSRYEFTSEFQLFHVIAHMSYHMVHGGLGIRPFLDLWLLRNKTVYDETALQGMCSECGILTFYEKSARLVDAWMSGEPTAPDLSEFENFCLQGGVFGSAELTLASKQRNKSGTRYLLGRVFMSRAALETEYPELKEKPYLLPSRQVKRWTRLFNKKMRTHVRQELKEFRALDSQTVESFNSLLNSLGL